MKLLLAIVLVAALLAAVILWMAGGVQGARTFDGPIGELGGVPRSASEPTASSTITVVTWNIAWGYGWGSEGSDKARPKEHFERSVERLGEVLAGLGADLVLLQEIDFDSTRSHRVDQAERIARRAGLPFVARAPSWRAAWVPFPYWPPSEHFGHMASGGAVLSRFPVRSNTVELLPKPEANAFWYNLFYLFRYIERVEVELPGVKVPIVNVHLEAFNTENRVAQAKLLAESLAGEAGGGSLLLFGGDLNAVPPEQPVKTGYADEPGTSHEGDHTLDVLRAVPGLSDSVAPAVFAASPERFFTFPSHAPSRKLDYLFTGSGWEVLEARVGHEAGEVSDHLPIVVRLRRRAP